jgi:hypothetical protein
MYNDPSAKDLLAQYPRQYAEGGEATPPASQSWQAPVVQAARTQLKQFTPGLSASQLYARDRAAQDALLSSTYENTGAVPLSNEQYRDLQQKMRRGELTAENIQEKLINPIYEDRVTKAYAAIGRTGPLVGMANINVPGATADTYKAVDQEGYDYWLNKLKSGEITGKQFQDTFLRSAAETPKGDNAGLLLSATNKARKALGMTEIPASDLPGYQAPATTPEAWNSGRNILSGIGTQPWQNTIFTNRSQGATTATTDGRPASFTAAPVQLGGNKTNPSQLFNEGGDVKKYDEPDRQSGMSDEDKDAYNVGVNYRKEFAEGGDVKK